MPQFGTSQAAQLLTLPFRRHKQRYVINPPEETHSVVYLGNVLTLMAKGEGAIERPLAAIWRSYTTRKRDVPMKLSVTRNGLRVETKQLGTVCYNYHRITYCSVGYFCDTRVFCWIYKHEGKRLRHDLRCHAVLCRKRAEPAHLVTSLTSHLQAALSEYKREKLVMEKSRKNSLTSGVSCPRRKLMLQTGTANFHAPVNRSKSTPRLGSIDECDEAEAEAAAAAAAATASLSDYEDGALSDLESLGYRGTPLISDDDEPPLGALAPSTSTAAAAAAADAAPSNVAESTSPMRTPTVAAQCLVSAENDERLSQCSRASSSSAASSSASLRRARNASAAINFASRPRWPPPPPTALAAAANTNAFTACVGDAHLRSLVVEADALRSAASLSLSSAASSSCASSDDGFASSCQSADFAAAAAAAASAAADAACATRASTTTPIAAAVAAATTRLDADKRRRVPLERATSDFSDDSDDGPAVDMETTVEQIRRIFTNNVQVTAL